MKRLYLIIFSIFLSIFSVAQFKSTSIYLDNQPKTQVGYTTVNYGYTTNYGTGFSIARTSKTGPSYNPAASSSPRKSPQRPFSGNFLEDLADWWRINTDSDWPSYVDEDYWEQFLEEYPEYADEAEEWFEEHGQTPPWLTPIGDGVNFLCILIMIYFMIKLCIRKVDDTTI